MGECDRDRDRPPILRPHSVEIDLLIFESPYACFINPALYGGGPYPGRKAAGLQ